MRKVMTTLLLFAFMGLGQPVRNDPASDFLTLARHAIADPATLVNVHSLYQLTNLRSVDAGMGSSSVEASLSRASGPPTAMWLAPPSRYLVKRGAGARGFDGVRVIDVTAGVAPPDQAAMTNRFRHWALALLLYDPGALGVTMHDLGTRPVEKKPLRVLEATADDFKMALYFDVTSHRLVMSEDSSVATEFLSEGGRNSAPMPQAVATRQVAERET
jgi:hypothetical protein